MGPKSAPQNLNAGLCAYPSTREIPSPAALLGWIRFASLIGTCKMNGVEPYAYLCDLFTRLANGHLAKDIDALMPWAYGARNKASQ